jgi:hypothetical protein
MTGRTLGPLDDHFTLINRLKRARGEERAAIAAAMVQMSKAVAAHWRIDYPGESLPQHPGFERVVIEQGKRRDWAAVIAAAALAKAEGWAGDWDRRIAWAARRVPRETE